MWFLLYRNSLETGTHKLLMLMSTGLFIACVETVHFSWNDPQPLPSPRYALIPIRNLHVARIPSAFRVDVSLRHRRCGSRRSSPSRRHPSSDFLVLELIHMSHAHLTVPIWAETAVCFLHLSVESWLRGSRSVSPNVKRHFKRIEKKKIRKWRLISFKTW